MSKTVQTLLHEINNIYQKSEKITDSLKRELDFYIKQGRLHNFDYLQNILNDLHNNKFLDSFHDSTIKISISDNYNNGNKRSFLVDTLSPEFLKALENELKNSLTKKAIELNNLLLSTAQYEPIPDDETEWSNRVCKKEYLQEE
jgi:hypothetical protein